MKPTTMNFLATLVPQGLLRFLAFNSTLIYCGLIILLVVAVFIWAAVWRQPSKRKLSRHHWKAKDGVSSGNGRNADSPPKPRRRHKRRRPRKPLNPTLAETRGLPPVRDEESTPPPSY